MSHTTKKIHYFNQRFLFLSSDFSIIMLQIKRIWIFLLYCYFSACNAYTQGEITSSLFPQSYLAERQQAAQLIQPKQYEGLLIVEYIIDSINNKLHIFTVDKNNGLQLVTAPIPADFNKKIEAFKQLLHSFYLATDAFRMQFIEQSHAFYKLIIMPIESKLVSKSNIHIITRNALKNLPLEVLISSDQYAQYTDLPYLLRRFKVSYAAYVDLAAYADARARLFVDVDKNTSKDMFILASDDNATAYAQINTTNGSLYAPTDDRLQQAPKQTTSTSINCGDLMETGVQNVIVSSWLTSEKITNNLLAEVYSYLATNNHKCYASALQGAKLKMLKKPETAVPNQWSGYLLIKH
jgi:CHAT domain-containing protein